MREQLIADQIVNSFKKHIVPAVIAGTIGCAAYQELRTLASQLENTRQSIESREQCRLENKVFQLSEYERNNHIPTTYIDNASE